MSIQIIRSDRRNREKIVSRYMREIRDIAKAGLSRRELLRRWLVSGGGGLLAMHAMRHFKSYWAHAAILSEDLILTSPPNTPFADPLPIPPIMRATNLNPPPTRGPNPTAVPLTRPIVGGFTEAVRPDHQRWTEFGGVSNTIAGFRGPQYESVEMP